MMKCLDHLNFAGGTCPDCGLEVNQFGNTEEQFEFCSFPACGCDGSRNCTAGVPSERAGQENVEGMWNLKTLEHRRAVGRLIVKGLKP